MSGRRLTCRRSKCRAATSYCPGSQEWFRFFPQLSMFWARNIASKSRQIMFSVPPLSCAIFHVVQVASEGFRSDLCNTEHLTSVGPRNRNSFKHSRGQSSLWSSTILHVSRSSCLSWRQVGVTKRASSTSREDPSACNFLLRWPAPLELALWLTRRG